MISVHFQEKAFNITQVYASIRGFPHSSVSKVSACNAGNLGLIPGLGRSPGEGHGNLLQDSCLENPMGRGAWQATVPGVARVGHDLVIKLPQPPCLNHWYWRNWNWPVLWRVKTPSRTNTKKKKNVLFIIVDWNAKVGSQEIPRITGNFALEYKMKQGKG